jgi:hypothetical protein
LNLTLGRASVSKPTALHAVHCHIISSSPPPATLAVGSAYLSALLAASSAVLAASSPLVSPLQTNSRSHTRSNTRLTPLFPSRSCNPALFTSFILGKSHLTRATWTLTILHLVYRSLPSREAALIHGVSSLRATLRGPPEIAANTMPVCSTRNAGISTHNVRICTHNGTHHAIASRSVLSTQPLAIPLISSPNPPVHIRNAPNSCRPNHRQRYRAQKHANHSGLPTTPAAGR